MQFIIKNTKEAQLMQKQMTLEDIQGKRIKTITKANDGGYFVVLEDGSAVGFTGQLRQIDTNTFQTATAIQTIPAQQPQSEQPETTERTPDTAVKEG